MIGMLDILRPTLGRISGSLGLLSMIVLIVSTVGVIVLHELIHGLCFWAFTRTRPHYGFKGLYAYAAAPDWYIPRGPTQSPARPHWC